MFNIDLTTFPTSLTNPTPTDHDFWIDRGTSVVYQGSMEHLRGVWFRIEGVERSRACEFRFILRNDSVGTLENVRRGSFFTKSQLRAMGVDI